MSRDIVLATRSSGKIRELVEIVSAAGLTARTLAEVGIPVDPAEEQIEVFNTFEANAVAKARWFAARSAGVAVLADDSGLCVDALGGDPGVRSKRWASAPGLDGEALDAANNARLVREIASHADRSARYVCVVAIKWPGGELFGRGECAGTIVTVPRGTGGFGYDPYFLSTELGVTFGEARNDAKEHVSHRGRAVRAALASYALALR